MEDKNVAVDRIQYSLGMICLLKEEQKKKEEHQLLSFIKPPSVPSSASVPFPIEWVLVRDANVFMGDVSLEYC